MPPSSPEPTVAAALREGARRLQDLSPSARLDAELLMAHALGVSRSDLLLRHMDGPVPAGFAALLTRRAGREPIAHIIGTQDFFGREFLVTGDVLIPRSDSETVVQAALDAVPAPARVLDCGTGSGALLLTLLAESPGARGVGIDRSDAALEVARRNAARLALADRTTLMPGDWTVAGWADRLGRFDLILANPPYVEDGAVLEPDVREFEPAGALYAGPEGLDDYRVLIPQLPGLLTPGGAAVIEIGATQAAAVTAIASRAGFCALCRRDLGQRPRALVLTLGLGK